MNEELLICEAFTNFIAYYEVINTVNTSSTKDRNEQNQFDFLGSLRECLQTWLLSHVGHNVHSAVGLWDPLSEFLDFFFLRRSVHDLCGGWVTSAILFCRLETAAQCRPMNAGGSNKQGCLDQCAIKIPSPEPAVLIGDLFSLQDCKCFKSTLKLPRPFHPDTY